MKVVTGYLKEALSDIGRQEEVVERVMNLLQKVSLNHEILEASEIGNQLLRMKEKKQLSEQVKAKWFKYFTKYKQLIENWREEYQKKKHASQ